MTPLKWSRVCLRQLTRHYLIKPTPGTKAAEVVRAVCGLQAQVLSAAELPIGARVKGITQQGVLGGALAAADAGQDLWPSGDAASASRR